MELTETPTIKRDFEYVIGKTYYYIGSRSGYANVLIGLFDSKQSAEYCLEIGWSKKLIKVATKQQIKTFFGLK